ncbi:O-antigen ligase family protein [Rhizobium sp. ARZ01]|uniref:O-antigen ligase family protein n=1 Tax=Rhizobium sp. ARZ01 TaxID=2769313 RepID=UPI00178345A7|nr:O-antigen ligase [Rhizobium sp. ARZ01]MBD9375019.1 O-antigen ligase family protein [Rhizobium sp. ARZ01]
MSNATGEPFKGHGGWFSSVLFVVVFYYFWIGLAPFPNPNDDGLLTAYGNASNLVNQLIVVAMSFLVLATLLQHPERQLVLRSYGPLVIIFLWLLFTALFSDAPAIALRRIVFAALVCLCASAVLLLPRSSAHFAKLIGLCLLFAVSLSLFGVFALPHRAIHQATDALEQSLAGDWRGHLGHKNVAAAAMVYAVFFGLYIAKRRSFRLGAPIVLFAATFLLNSGGKTSAAMLPATLVACWLFERCGPFRLLLLVGGLGASNAILLSAAVSPSIQNFLTSMGVDPTFTDRTSIWELALSAIANRPFTGYGFQSFWQTDALVYSGQSIGTWAVSAANAHNGYLDQVINGGLPLLLLMLVWLVFLPCYHAGLALKRQHDPELTRLFIRVWLFSLFTSCLENIFFDNSGPIWFTMLISVFGLRLQAYAYLTKAPSLGTIKRAPLNLATT